MKKFRVLFLMLVFALACSSSYSNLKIESDYNPMVDFKSIKTFDFAPGQKITSNDARVNVDFVDSRIRKAIEDTLTKKKLQKVAAAQPDVWIDYQAILGKGERSRLIMDFEVQADSEEVATYTETFDKGSVLLTVLNPKTGKSIYSGSARAQVDLEVDWQAKEERIQIAVGKILENFPPKR